MIHVRSDNTVRHEFDHERDKVILRVRSHYARFVVIRVLFIKKSLANWHQLTRILNDECKFDEYVHLHCLPSLYE